MWDQVNVALRESASRVLTGVASVLPGVVAMLVAVLIAGLIGWLFRALFVRALRGVHFDERLDQLGFGVVAEMSPNHSAAQLAGRLIFWFILLLGLLVGLAAIDPERTSLFFGAFLAYLPNIFVAILLLVIGAIVARSVGRSVLLGAVNMQIQSARLLSVGVKWMIMVLATAMALTQLHIGGTVLTLAFGILFGGIVFALSLAVGLGSKDMVRKSWERQAERRDESVEAPFQHL